MQTFAALVLSLIKYALFTFWDAMVDAFAFIAAFHKLCASFVELAARGVSVASFTIFNAA